MPVDEERTFLTLMLHRLGANEFMFPLWIDGLKIDTLAAGISRINFPTADTEYQAGLALLLGETAFDYEVVEIISVDAGGVDLSEATALAFARGAHLYPLLRGRLEDNQQVTRTLQRLGQATLRFNVTKANPRTVDAEVATLYRGDPVLETWPDEREPLDYQFDRVTHRVDSEYGLPYVVDEAGRAFTADSYAWFLSSKAKQSTFRDMLYRLRGRTKARWIPSFARDMKLTENAAAAANVIRVAECGLTYVGGPYDGRQDIRVEMTDGTAFHRRITGSSLYAGGMESLVLDTGVPVALTPATVKRIAFMDMGRLDNDAIEIMHHTNTVATVKAAFRKIKTGRTAALPIDLPIPAAEMGGPCGDVETCSPAPEWESGFWGRLDILTNLGPQIPVVGPWAWIFNLYIGDTLQVGMVNSDNYTDYDGGGPDPWTLPYSYLQGWTTYMMTPDLALPRGEAGWAADPFSAGMPDKLDIQVIQWPYNNYIFPGGSVFGDGETGTMSIMFHRVNGDTLNFGTIPIFGLWPASYTLYPV